MTRYKVWTIDPDGEPSTILVRTGSTETLDADTPEHFGAGHDEVQRLAMFAWEHRANGKTPPLLIKNFDANVWYEARMVGAYVQVVVTRNHVQRPPR